MFSVKTSVHPSSVFDEPWKAHRDTQLGAPSNAASGAQRKTEHICALLGAHQPGGRGSCTWEGQRPLGWSH